MKVRDMLQGIGGDEEVMRRWPLLSKLLDMLGDALYEIEHEMDWDVSSDSHIEDDAGFEARAVWSLLEPAMKAAPDEFFPRGKWAMIQAVQARAMNQEV